MDNKSYLKGTRSQRSARSVNKNKMPTENRREVECLTQLCPERMVRNGNTTKWYNEQGKCVFTVTHRD